MELLKTGISGLTTAPILISKRVSIVSWFRTIQGFRSAVLHSNIGIMNRFSHSWVTVSERVISYGNDFIPCSRVEGLVLFAHLLHAAAAWIMELFCIGVQDVFRTRRLLFRRGFCRFFFRWFLFFQFLFRRRLLDNLHRIGERVRIGITRDRNGYILSVTCAVDIALHIGMVYFYTGIPQSAQCIVCRMSVCIVLTDGDDGNLWHDLAQERILY